jgi:hypothetical protein
LLNQSLNTKQMETKQALGIIKQILDAASKSGLFENLNAAMTAADAYNAVAREILKNEDNDDRTVI